MSQTLRVGDIGPAVAQLHHRLQQLGYPVAAEEQKRQFFGPATREAVQSYQRQRGLAVSGEVDEATAAAIGRAMSGANATPAPVPRQPVVTRTPASLPGRELSLPGITGRTDVEVDRSDRYRITGHVRTTEGIAVPGLTIQALDKKVLQEPTPLGSTTTDDEGTYHLDYTDRVTELGLADSIDLLVQCQDSTGNLLQQSPLQANAPRHTTVNFTVTKTLRRSPSVFEQRDGSFRELIGDVDLLQLRDDAGEINRSELTYLTAKLNLSEPDIKRLIYARWLQADARSLKPDGEIPLVAFYALTHSEEPPNLEAVVNQPRATLAETLRQAVADNVIQLATDQSIEAIVDGLKAIAIDLAWAEPDDRDAYTIRNLVDCTGLAEPLQRQFVEAYTLNDQPMPQFWQALPEQYPDLKPHHATFQRLFDLASFTENNLPLVRALSRHRVEVKQFARFSAKTWQWYGHRYGASLAEDEPAKLAQRFQSKYPTVHLIHRLSRDPALNAQEKPSDILRSFLDRHSDFVFGQESVSRYLRQDEIQKALADELNAIEAEDERLARQQQQAALKQELRQLEFAYTLAPATDKITCTAALRALELEERLPALPAANNGNGNAPTITVTSEGEIEAPTPEETPPRFVVRRTKADSALKIALAHPMTLMTAWKQVRDRQGHHEPKKLYQEAKEIYDKARYQAFRTTFSAWNAASTLDTVKPAVCAAGQARNAEALSNFYFLSNGSTGGATTPINYFSGSAEAVTIPDLQTLFGNSSYCECVHCQSIYSPARYLANIYALLPPAQKQMLEIRRPDILRLYLNCQNTHTKLPYIDLVNELLEGVVIETLSGPRVSSIEETVFQPLWCQLVLSYQTTHREEELILRPEHENLIAYALLASSEDTSWTAPGINNLFKFSLSLPWDKWLEEANLYLGYMGLNIHRLVEIFLPSKITEQNFSLWQHQQSQWCNAQVIRAHLNLTTAQSSLICRSLTTEDKTPIPEDVRFVQRFMEGLDLWEKDQQYESGKGKTELFQRNFKLFREILGCRYIQNSSTGSLTIVAQTDDCNIEDDYLSVPTYNTIARLEVFERLRRQLEWRPRELNQAIQILSRGTIDESLLTKISHLLRLQKQTPKLSIMELLSWWGTIETGANWEPIGPFYEGENKQEEKLSLYEKVFLGKSLYGTDLEVETSEPAKDWSYFVLNGQKTQLNYLEERDPSPFGSNLSHALSPYTNSRPITDFAATVSAALGLRENEVLELSEYLSQAYVSLQSPSIYTQLNLASLSALYRFDALSRCLKLNIHELIIVHKLLTGNSFSSEWEPFPKMHAISVSPITPSTLGATANDPIMSPTLSVAEERPFTLNTVLFVEAVQQIQRSPFKIRDLAYLWHHETESTRELENIASQHEAYLGDLKQRLRELKNQPFSGPSIKELTQVLSDLVHQKVHLRTLKNFFLGGSIGPTNPEAYLNQHLPFLSAEQLDQILGWITPGVPSSQETLQKITAILQPHAVVANTLRQDLASFFNLQVDQLKPLVALNTLPDCDSDRCLMKDFLQWAANQFNNDFDIDEVQIKAYLLWLDKCAELIQSWQLSPAEVQYIETHPEAFEGFTFYSLPTEANVRSKPTFKQWSSLENYAELRRKIAVKPEDLVNLFDKAHQAASEPSNTTVKHEKSVEVLSDLAVLLRIEVEELRTIATTLGLLNSGTNAEIYELLDGALTNGDTLRLVFDVIKAMRLSGQSCDRLAHWVHEPIADDDLGETDLSLDLSFDSVVEQFESADDAKQSSLLRYKNSVVEDIRNTVRANVSDSAWQVIARKHQDSMRTLQRDKLLDAILAPIGFRSESLEFSSVEAVYDHLLIDPLVNPCMQTTRLKQAISSVQLLIHQSLMGLKGPAVQEWMQNHIAAEWQWKKNYRIWEAQQKIWLYPENWIEPELRDNKTPFFEEFETELSQSALDEKVIEQAYKTYLHKVDEVGHLEVAAFTEHENELHVIGRTRETPHTHYYRKRTADNIWHPWERVELDIDSEVVLMIVHQGHLYVFWPTVKERVQKLGQDNSNDSNNDKNNYRPLLEIHFSWSRYEDGRWLPHKKSQKGIHLLYDWSYKEHYSDVEPLIEYDIQSAIDGITISLNILTSTLDKVDLFKLTPDPFVPATITRYTWDESKLEKIFQSIYRLVDEIDWAYIHGRDFHYSASDVKEMLHLSLENCKSEVTMHLYHNQPEEAVSAIRRLVNIDMSLQGIDVDSPGILELILVRYPSQFANRGGNRGLRETDQAAINTLLGDISDTKKSTINIKMFKYNVLKSWQGGIEGGLIRRQPIVIGNAEYYFRSKRFNFAKITFLGYRLESKGYNFTGLVSETSSHREFTSDDAEADSIPYPYASFIKTGNSWSFENTGLGLYKHVPTPVGKNIEYTEISEVIPCQNKYIIDSYEIDEKEFDDDNGIFLYLNLEGERDPREIFRLKEKRVYLTLNDPMGAQLNRFFFCDSVSCQQLSRDFSSNRYLCSSFYHHFIRGFNKILAGKVIDSFWQRIGNLLALEEQAATHPFPYEMTADSHIRIEHIQDDGTFKDVLPLEGEPDYRVERDQYYAVEFGRNHPFGVYNWEIFFHMPFTIAVRLSQDKQFEKAQRWFHYIFNPLKPVEIEGEDYSTPDRQATRYWNFLPLHQLGMSPKVDQVSWNTAVNEAAKDPFNPHRIARSRLGAYQKAVVMKYLDNLIDWGDYLFERDTIESINEATHLYILAAKILGSRPKVMPQKTPNITHLGQPVDAPTLQTLSDYSDHLDNLAQVDTQEELIAELESSYWENFSQGIGQILTAQVYWGDSPRPAFCIPHNDHLLTYWDTVADRLFKIRNCRNIAGQVRELPTFEPPIDPALLVRGKALNVDISELLSDLYTPLPPYRFRVTLQKALEFCGDVQRLGGALLSVLEKRDAEGLALLRSKHERQLLKLNETIRKQQIQELKETLKATQASLAMAEVRFEYYDSREFENPQEKAEVALLNAANAFNISSQALAMAAAPAYSIPQMHTSTMTGATDIEVGGRAIGDALTSMSKFLGMIGSHLSHEAHMQSIQGSRRRRMDDWQFQAQQARQEIKQLQKQILASEIRIAMAEQELENLRKQQDHAEEVETFLKSKFTNQELYHWMVSQTSTLYFQSYKLSLELARKAQKCYRMEQCDDAATFIGATYWDNLKKGLLAGETLQLDLRRMESAYLQRNERELEITKHISLALLNPLELLKLRETGSCSFDVPEVLFDLDHPGHYRRRIKAISLTLPCVAGPYTSVSATLTLQSSRTRKTTDLGDDDSYAWSGNFEDNRFNYDIRGIQSIATSTAQNDSGLFELNFNDERYLPFEGAGAISTWQLELPQEFRQFDYDTISDVVLHLRYTARDGGPDLKDKANEAVGDLFADASEQVPLLRAFSARQEFPSEWHQFLHPKETDESHKLDLAITPNRFPFQFRNKSIVIREMQFFLKLKDGTEYDDDGQLLSLTLRKPNQERPYIDPSFKIAGSPVENIPYLKAFEEQSEPLGDWCLEVPGVDIASDGSETRRNIPDYLSHPDNEQRLNPDAIDDLIIVCHYSVQ
jgi:hypothetical protein